MCKKYLFYSLIFAALLVIGCSSSPVNPYDLIAGSWYGVWFKTSENNLPESIEKASYVLDNQGNVTGSSTKENTNSYKGGRINMDPELVISGFLTDMKNRDITLKGKSDLGKKLNFFFVEGDEPQFGIFLNVTPREDLWDIDYLTGDWYCYWAQASQSAPFYGKITLDSSQEVTSLSFSNSDLNIDKRSSLNLSDDYGTIAGTIHTSDATDTYDINLIGNMNENKEFIISTVNIPHIPTPTSTYSSDWAGVMIKGGGFFDTIDLFGNWHYFCVEDDSSGKTIISTNSFTVNINGEIIPLQLKTLSDESTTSTGTLILDQVGKITGNFTNGQTNMTIEDGKMDQGKSLIGAYITSANGSAMCLFSKNYLILY
jgi:hypothetical protein